MSTPNPQVQAPLKPPSRPIEITAVGMLTPLGADAVMTAAAVRSDISAYAESSILNKQFNPMILSLVPDAALPPLDEALASLNLTSRQQRLLRLATPAMQQLQDVMSENTPLLLCGPEKMPGRRSVISDTFLKHLAVQTKTPFDMDNSYVFPDGRAAGFYALEVAMQLLETGSQTEVMIGGVDSYLDTYLLATLDRDDRVLCGGAMDAFAPGEAAVFILVKLADDNSAVKIYPPGIADEPGHRYSTEPYKGEGLASAVRESISNGEGHPIKTVFASFNGENFSAKEWGVSAIRNRTSFDDDFNLVHPADCYGDIGAATAPMLMALAAMGMSEGHYQKPALIWASSEIQQRAAACIG